MLLHGIDLDAADLPSELSKVVDANRSVPGFFDFSLEGRRAIEPGKPAQSLLFHAFASPAVLQAPGGKGWTVLTDFPTPAEIEAVENYVYGVVPPSIAELRAKAQGEHMAIVVFAREYRPAALTVHGKHADMCFSRTGVARVGTEQAEYLADARGYLPFSRPKSQSVRVLPCRYSAYIAVLAAGEAASHGPMRFIQKIAKPASASTSTGKQLDAGRPRSPTALDQEDPGDANRRFWIPVHKLFDGEECIRGRSIKLRLAASHVNEKLRRAHLRFLGAGYDAGWAEPDLSEAPFIFSKGIAEFSGQAQDGSWLLVPEPHAHLVEAASYKGKPLTYRVPEKAVDGVWRVYQSSHNFLPLASGARAAPEYLHARHVVLEDGSEQNLNHAPDLVNVVKKGGYQARHYLDFTGDGWIEAECPALALEVPRRLPAYSIVASPDFFPFVGQADLMRWTEQSVLPSVLGILWDAPGSGLPQALSDQRYAANLNLPEAGFDPADDTMTAVVGLLSSGQGPMGRIDEFMVRRSACLPDAAAGVFAPGWDVSYDRSSELDSEDTGRNLKPGVTFLTNYGLGSPFPEDSMLCAALSSFWPAVTPDITRTFAPGRNYATATPLTDDVIGIGGASSWDGVAGPVLSEDQKTVRYQRLAYGDYVEAALAARFDITLVGSIQPREYIARTLSMALVYHALGVEAHADKIRWSVLSFNRVDPEDKDFVAALAATGRSISADECYRFVVFRHDRPARDDPDKFNCVLLDVDELVLLFADPSFVLRLNADGTWSVHELRR